MFTSTNHGCLSDIHGDFSEQSSKTRSFTSATSTVVSFPRSQINEDIKLEHIEFSSLNSHSGLVQVRRQTRVWHENNLWESRLYMLHPPFLSHSKPHKWLFSSLWGKSQFVVASKQGKQWFVQATVCYCPDAMVNCGLSCKQGKKKSMHEVTREKWEARERTCAAKVPRLRHTLVLNLN